MGKWGKLEFGKKGPDGIKGEGIDESSQGELYEKDVEIKDVGAEIKKILDSINDEKTDDEKFKKSLDDSTNSEEKTAEEYAAQIKEDEEMMTKLDKNIKELKQDLEEIFG